jgi:hypothetical protein
MWSPTQTAGYRMPSCLFLTGWAIRLSTRPVSRSFSRKRDDPTSHNIHPIPANNREWNKSEPPNSKTEETFSRAEIAIPVKCNIHPWMHGYVAVFKHPYFAVTGKDGSFDLSSLPPGTYTVEAWHEKLGTSTQQITVGANETKAVNLVLKPRSGT